MVDYRRTYQQFLAELYEVAHKVGRKQKEMTVVAVSKTHPISDLEQIYSLGCRDFGENRVPEFLEKEAHHFHGHGDVRWHFIGPLQKNKVNKIIGKTTLIHSVDSVELAKKISEASLEAGIVTAVLLQVNASGEASKQGFTPASFMESLPAMRELKGLTIEGLMTMAPLTEDPIPIRRTFSTLRKLRDETGLLHLSMGMSNDFKIAVEEGATILRVGSKIFQ